MSKQLELAALLALMAVALMYLRRRPKLAVVLWFCSICFVPVWMGVSVKFYLLPTVVVAAVVLLVLLPIKALTLSLADLLVAFFALVCVTPIVVGGASGAFITVLVLQWLPAFLVGRVMPLRVDASWIYGCVSVVFSVVAVLAIAEYLLHWNPFLLLHASNPLYDSWSPVLSRGGVARVEGAFGHPIALGVCLALALPFVFVSRFVGWQKMAMVVVIAIGIVPTFSRSAMLCGGMSMATSLLFVRDGLSARIRILSLSAVGVVTIAFIPLVGEIFTQAGTEATNSASYRTALLSLAPRMSILGLSPSATENAYGVHYFARFKSIDSAVILLGLTVGWIAVAVVLLLIVGAAVVVVIGRADPATVAVVAAVPALATVALITQYSMFFWFLAGMAACAQAQRRAGPAGQLAVIARPPDGLNPAAENATMVTSARTSHHIGSLDATKVVNPRGRS